MKSFAPIVVLWLPLLAIAQTPDSSGVSSESVPLPACTQPVLPPRIQPRSEDLDRFGRELFGYRKCVEAYVKDRSDDMRRENALARANADAANAAVQRLNDLMKQIQNNASSP